MMATTTTMTTTMGTTMMMTTITTMISQPDLVSVGVKVEPISLEVCPLLQVTKPAMSGFTQQNSEYYLNSKTSSACQDHPILGTKQIVCYFAQYFTNLGRGGSMTGGCPACTVHFNISSYLASSTNHVTFSQKVHN